VTERTLEGRVAVITGASKGVGREMAVAFAADGAKVVVNYGSDRDGAESTVEAIQRSGGEALAVKADVSRRQDVEEMLRRTLETFGGVDILVNNAGLSRDLPFLELTDEDWDRVIAVNLRGPFLCTQVFGAEMKRRGRGKVINISSGSATRARVNAANYCSSKAGVNSLTQSTALELAPEIQVNGIALGFIDSELVRQLFTPEELERVAAASPAGRMGRMEEINRLALYLASSDSDFMTGQTLLLDGGRILV
jgi:3-oxoacyl-[acyl-carrier protein] reductase